MSGVRRRVALAGAAGAVALAAASASGLSGAAFVDSAATPQQASADRVGRWLGLEAPSAGTCAAPADVVTAGADDALRVVVGGVGAGTDRAVGCALVVVARDPLPGGAPGVTVHVSGSADGALPDAALTALDGSDPAQDVTLAPGQRRAIRLTMHSAGADAAPALRVIARPEGDTSDFLSYAVPVGASAQDGTPSTVTPPSTATPSTTTPDAGGPAVLPADPGAGGAGAAAPAPAPGTVAGAGAPAATPPRACLSRRHVVIHLRQLPRGERYRSARVVLDGRALRVRRGSRWSAVADLRGRTRQTIRVVIVARTSIGRRLREVRTYRTCLRRTASPAKAPR